jgi:photosystem II stability/assembly factor-like uncharacterized protein
MDGGKGKHHIINHGRILLACLLSAGSSHAQNLWEWQNPLPQGNALYDICFVDSLRGWAVGGAGTVLRTTDGGGQWHTTQVPTHELLTRTSFVNPNRGWAMTYLTHRILRTTDGGITWDSISTLPSSYYLDLRFLNDSIGFASGSNGKIMRTTDGGLTWNATQTNFTGDIYTLHFASDSIGWGAGPGAWALKTTNGGLTWTYMLTAGLEPSSRRIFSLDAERAYIVGSHDFFGTITGFLYSTTDGGATWQTRYFDRILSDVYYSSPTTGWVSDIDGVIHQTTNGGTTWTELDRRASRFTFCGSSHAWGIHGSGLILGTDDGWKTYRPQTQVVTTQILWAVSVFDSNHAAACGANSVVVGTKDGGANWSEYYSPMNQKYLVDILYKSAGEIWAVGEGGALVHSTDGGVSWYDSTLSDPWLSGIAFATEQIGFIVSSSGTVYRSVDAGRTWRVHTSLGNTPLERIAFSSPMLGWIAADDGVYRSTDGGETWQHVNGTAGLALDIAAVGNHAWYPAVNSVMYTSDAGLTWASRSVFPVGNIISIIRSLAFADESNGWVVADNGRSYRTTDGGDHWAMDSDINGNPLFGIRFADPKRGWAVGTDGAILRFNNAPLSVADDRGGEFPKRFSLEQNYPNPFNPTTKIQFTIVNRQLILVKVYDMLGREVSTLVNEVREPGTYTVQFDARLPGGQGSNLASGVYFYKMQAGQFVQTRKLLLLR